MSDLKAGDVVKLKCHPQEMMVDHFLSNEFGGSAVCVWIDDYGQPHREEYVKEVLELVGESELSEGPPGPLKRKPLKETLFNEDDPELGKEGGD